METAKPLLTEDPKTPSIFHDLTKKEIRSIQRYLYQKSGLDIAAPSANRTDASFIYTMELYLPDKSLVVDYLDNNGTMPVREAIVIILRGKLTRPGILEIIVSPLPKPTSHRAVPGRPPSIPYIYRSVTSQDYTAASEYISHRIDNELGDLLQDAFGTKLRNCENKCLAFRYISQFSPVSSGTFERKIWYWMSYFAEFFFLHPVNFAVLLKTSLNRFEIDLIWFNGKSYNSTSDLAKDFRNGKLRYNKRTFPKEDRNLYSTLNQRGNAPRFSEKRDPIQIYPDGARYEVKQRHVNYMDWSFDFRLSTTRGPQIYDVRFRNERIIYEAGLQEISVYYSGHSPQQKFSDFLDSTELMGPGAVGLIPGIDCPEHASFVGAYHVREYSGVPEESPTAFCVFEWNTGDPLRRHYSKSTFEGAFYEGMPSSVLILRTAIKIANYDYLIDFIFYQNGVFELKATSTGFILANSYTPEEEPFGFRVQDHVFGNYHLHLFNFKIDLDVKGHKNRYETLDLSTATEPNPFSAQTGATDTQGKINRNLKKSELEAAFKYNFDEPKYHIFYNKDHLNKFGNPRAYRLYGNGFVKQILPEGVNMEPSVSWSRHQMAVSRLKETERFSSSLYSMFDTVNPIVNFTTFIADDESIIDEDLVVWVTLGMHHIPHTEDLPQVTTPGLGKSVFLTPFNYFQEDPAMTSTNALRIEPKKLNDPDSGIIIERYGKSPNMTVCRIERTNFFQSIMENPNMMFTD
ncbi:hypothetical protein FSP39_010829 [Pinctada imbricata]|uniref:Amine oxidase n=1 Tax=Pinctada imbricata TaxID=66713 RepID=A0AA89C791_PINIB|nr:hypothetical protein FSP39_010829 [Pinctada imbricata]